MTQHPLDLLGLSVARALVEGHPLRFQIACAVAQWGLAVLSLAMAWLWLRGGDGARTATVGAGLAAGCSLAAAGALSFAIYVPRPFASGLTQNVFDHVADSALPSDHASVMAAVAAFLLLDRRWRPGCLAAALTIAVGAARVALGLHFPSDVLVGLAIGATAALALRHPRLRGFVTFTTRLAVALYRAAGLEAIAIRLRLERRRCAGEPEISTTA